VAGDATRPARHHVEEEYGGAGLGYLHHVVAMEEISRASASVGLSYGPIPISASTRFRRNGSEAQKRKYLPKLVTGEHVGALAMSEPGAAPTWCRCAPAPIKRRPLYPQRLENVITNGRSPNTWWSMQDDRTAGARGITAFIVEKSFKGFAPAQKLDKLACAASDTANWCSRLRGAGGERARRRRQRRQRADVRTRL